MLHLRLGKQSPRILGVTTARIMRCRAGTRRASGRLRTTTWAPPAPAVMRRRRRLFAGQHHSVHARPEGPTDSAGWRRGDAFLLRIAQDNGVLARPRHNGGVEDGLPIRQRIGHAPLRQGAPLVQRDGVHVGAGVAVTLPRSRGFSCCPHERRCRVGSGVGAGFIRDRVDPTAFGRLPRCILTSRASVFSVNTRHFVASRVWYRAPKMVADAINKRLYCRRSAIAVLAGCAGHECPIS